MIKKRRSGKRRGIAARWMTAILLFTIIILTAAAGVVIVSTRQSYYAAAEQALESRISKMIVRINNFPQSQREEELKKAIENFTDPRYEMLLIDREQHIIATSSGYAYLSGQPVDDIKNAFTAGGKGSIIGTSLSREHIIAVTQMLDTPIGETVAIRYVSSLENVDSSIMNIAQVSVLVCLVVLGISVIIGLFFVRSIVVPIGRIGQTASRIADGDFNVRVDNVYNDEIGELCDIINDMAVGLSVSDRVKNEFIASVSHELRTPLTSIKGWGETLKKLGSENEKILNQGLDIILNETERLSLLVEDLLDFSRLQAGGRMRFTFDVVDVAQELHQIMQLFERRAANLKMELKCLLPREELLISADKNRLRQVFANLIDNAIKYSRPGDAVTVAIDCGPRMVEIAISDTGVGIPAEELPLITQRFFKASNALSGSGIGLAVVKEIVDMHDGTLRIDSELGGGTTVTVSLPRLELEK